MKALDEYTTFHQNNGSYKQKNKKLLTMDRIDLKSIANIKFAS